MLYKALPLIQTENFSNKTLCFPIIIFYSRAFSKRAEIDGCTVAGFDQQERPASWALQKPQRDVSLQAHSCVRDYNPGF